MKIFSKGTLNWFDWFLIVGIIVCNLAYMLVTKSFDWMGFVAGVSGLICVVLVSKRSVANYIFGIVNVAFYAIVSYNANILGDAMLNAFYYFPMQFVGWYNWVKNNGGLNAEGEEDASIVKTKRMTLKQRIICAVGCAAFIILLGYLLDKHTLDPQPYKDSFTTVLSVVAMYLMVKAYMEQWMIWFVVNAVSVLMWLAVLLRGDISAGFMVIMWVFYLIVAINGLIVWGRAVKE